MTTKIKMLGIDLAKGSFQVCAVGSEGTVLYYRALLWTRRGGLGAHDHLEITDPERFASYYPECRIERRELFLMLLGDSRLLVGLKLSRAGSNSSLCDFKTVLYDRPAIDNRHTLRSGRAAAINISALTDRVDLAARNDIDGRGLGWQCRVRTHGRCHHG